MQDKLSIIVPTYNERDNVVPLVERIAAALAGRDYEIVLVDDNSTDGTIAAAEALAAEHPVRLLVRRDEKGLATAVLHGLAHAEGQVIGVMDADLQHPPEVLPKLATAIEAGADLAVASRYVPGGGCPQWGLVRRIISKVAIKIAHLLLPSSRRVNDPMSGFFMFRRDKLGKAALKPIGYKILLEIMLTGHFQDVREVPFIFEDRSAGASKLKASTQVEYLRHIGSLMARTGELMRLLKFIAVGITGIGVNQGLLWLLTDYGGLLYYISAVISIEASIVSNFVLNDFFTFADRRTGKSFLGRLLKFNLICLTGAAIQYGLLVLFTDVAGLYYLVSNLIGIVVAFIWNYFINSVWTWR